MLWYAHISVHEEFLVVGVLLHSRIHELESIKQARQLAYWIYRHLQTDSNRLAQGFELLLAILSLGECTKHPIFQHKTGVPAS